MKAKLILAVVMIAAVATLIVNMQHSEVEFVEVEQSDLSQKLILEGFVQYNQQVKVIAPISGVVRELLPAGSQVAQGETLFDVDSKAEESIVQLKQQIAALDKPRYVPDVENDEPDAQAVMKQDAEIALYDLIGQAQSHAVDYEKLNGAVETIHNLGAVQVSVAAQEDQQKQEQAQVYAQQLATYENSMLALNQEIRSHEQLKTQEKQLSNVSGVVIDATEVGDVVQRGQNLLTIGYGQKNIFAKLRYDQDIKEGMDAVIRLEQVSIPAKVGLVDSTAEIIAQKDFAVGKDQKLTIEIMDDRYSQALIIPSDCIINQDGKQYVMKKDGLSLTKTEIKADISEQDEFYAVILQGLEMGDKIAVYPEKYIN